MRKRNYICDINSYCDRVAIGRQRKKLDVINFDFMLTSKLIFGFNKSGLSIDWLSSVNGYDTEIDQLLASLHGFMKSVIDHEWCWKENRRHNSGTFSVRLDDTKGDIGCPSQLDAHIMRPHSDRGRMKLLNATQLLKCVFQWKHSHAKPSLFQANLIMS